MSLVLDILTKTQKSCHSYRSDLYRSDPFNVFVEEVQREPKTSRRTKI